MDFQAYDIAKTVAIPMDKTMGTNCCPNVIFHLFRATANDITDQKHINTMAIVALAASGMVTPASNLGRK